MTSTNCNFCSKYQVELSAGKTKLLLFSPKETDLTKYYQLISPIHIGDTNIEFVNFAEHVGVTRSLSGIMPHLHQRISSHKRALTSILSSGMSRSHRANPLASLKGDQSEMDVLSQHVKTTTENLLKLHSRTPESFVFLISGA